MGLFGLFTSLHTIPNRYKGRAYVVYMQIFYKHIIDL